MVSLLSIFPARHYKISQLLFGINPIQASFLQVSKMIFVLWNGTEKMIAYDIGTLNKNITRYFIS